MMSEALTVGGERGGAELEPAGTKRMAVVQCLPRKRPFPDHPPASEPSREEDCSPSRCPADPQKLPSWGFHGVFLGLEPQGGGCEAAMSGRRC